MKMTHKYIKEQGRGNVLKLLARKRKTVRTLAIVALIASKDTVNVRKQAGAELGQAQLKLRLGSNRLAILARVGC